MKRVWKWIMHLNAKVFCGIAALFFLGTVGYSMYQYMTPPEPIREGTGEMPAVSAPLEIGALAFVASQLAGDDITVPVDPFLPLAEELIRAGVTPTQARNSQPGGRGGTGTLAGGGKGGGNAGDGTGAPPGVKMVTPKISFLGFFKRPDGVRAALFSDSSNNSTFFYSPGKTVHGIEILGADMQGAKVRFPDGSEGTIPIRCSVELAPEPEKAAAPVG